MFSTVGRVSPRAVGQIFWQGCAAPSRVDRIEPQISQIDADSFAAKERKARKTKIQPSAFL
jgi:hypothetical protein